MFFTWFSGKVVDVTPIRTFRRSDTNCVCESRGSGMIGDGVLVLTTLISPSHSRYSWSKASLPPSVR